MNLLQLETEREARIIEIVGGRSVRQRLIQMGFHIGDTVRVRQRGTFGGPALVEIHGSVFALGRGVAVKIIVEAMA